MQATTASEITLAVLAGGQARRLGGADKGLVPWHGRPLIEHVLARLAEQVAAVLVIANRNHEAYARYGHPVHGDSLPGYLGPLAGMAAAAEHAATEWVLCVPCDTPLLPPELPERLLATAQGAGADVCVPHDGRRQQHAVCLFRRTERASLEAALGDGRYSVRNWLQGRRTAVADLSDRPEAFVNLNTPEDLERAAVAHPDPARPGASR